MKWTIIRYLAGNKFIQGSYIFLIAVPILARFFSKIENPVKIAFRDYNLQIDLTLPFTWTIFYFAALLFTFGEILYSLFVPKMIQNEKSLSIFLEQKKDFNHLRNYLSDIKKGVKKYFNNAASTIQLYSGLKQNERLYLSTSDGELLHNEYYNVYEYLDSSSTFIRIVITILFVVGLFLIGFNMYENLLYVINQINVDGK